MSDGVRFGSATYRAGALERIEDARLLLRSGRLALAMYVSRLAVEGMLRALIWLRDKRLDERHDLRRLAARVRELGLLRGPRDDDFVAQVQGVARRWQNNFRFMGDVQVERCLAGIGVAPGSPGSSLKRICPQHLNDCNEILRRCEVLWQRSGRRN